MKKLLFIAFIFSSINSFAQNVQLHYDFAEDRQFFTTTLEMFKPDKLGNTFFFVDMDYDDNGVVGAYWEIARVFKTEKMPIGIHAEFNSGTVGGFPINSAFLAGIDYSINASDFSKGVSFKALYKTIRDKHNASFQFTTVWYVNFWNNKMTFSGFADFWKEDSDFDFDGNVDANYIFLSEPQIWYNIHKNFSAGAELELTNNFGLQEGFKARPTAAVKWIF
ncbi:MAG: DUF5020 family protein [Bacteroidales bacterium]|nr:DUF5020 family protein [Bacteroidales bacterium]